MIIWWLRKTNGDRKLVQRLTRLHESDSLIDRLVARDQSRWGRVAMLPHVRFSLFLVKQLSLEMVSLSTLKVCPLWRSLPLPSASLRHRRKEPVKVNGNHNSFIRRSERLSYSETLIITPITNECVLAYLISREWRVVIHALFLHLLLLRSLNIFCIFHVLLGFTSL